MKKGFDLEGLDENSKKELSKIPENLTKHASGIAGDHLHEPIPNYLKAKNEKIIEGSNNTWIVLGRDRPSNRLSGYGGKGHTQVGTVDIVVGRMGPNPKSDVFVDPNFEIDAARIYISNKTDVDKNFGLANGNIGSAEGRSAVAIKADGVRLIAREGIKLVTGTDPKNSQGGVVDTTFGVDLIAGNMFGPDNDKKLNTYTDKENQARELDTKGLEPIPKGVALAFALDQLVEQVDRLSGILSAYLKAQMDLNAVLGTHFHISPFFGMPTTPSDTAATKAIETNLSLMQDCVMGIQKFKANLTFYKNTHLRPHGKYYFNSRFHNLN